MTASPYYMYVIYCADHSLYCGSTNNVAHRFATHQAYKGAKYTRVKHRHPLKLIYVEKFTSKHDALSAEYHFKHQPRAAKLSYLHTHGVDLPQKHD